MTAFCSNCGAGLSGTAKFCPSCATPVGGAPATPGAPPPRAVGVAPSPRKKRGRGWLIVGGGGVGVLVLLGIIGAASGGGSDNKDQQVSAGVANASVSTASAAKPPPTPIPGIGESLRLDKDGWVITVTGTHTAPTVKGVFGDIKTALGVYLIVDITMENIGKEAHALGGDRFTVIDSQGRKFPYYSDGSIGNGRKQLGDKVNPGLSGAGTMVFDVPKDATGLVIETLGGKRITLGDVAGQ